MSSAREKFTPRADASVALVGQVAVAEAFKAPEAIWTVSCLTPKPGLFGKVVEVQERIRSLEQKTGFQRFVRKLTGRLADPLDEARALHDWMCRELMEEKWLEVEHNTVCTGGKNDLLDKYFGGSSYTAAWYCGLISSASYSAISASDTMASHAGWLEANASNAPNYSSSTRVALAFSSASSGSKATSSASSFTFSGGGTIKGMFGTSDNTKAGTTGILYNAVLFTGGDRIVATSDVVNVSVTYSA